MCASAVDIPRPWRRRFWLAGALMVVSLLAVAYGGASAMRPLGTAELKPGTPGGVSFEWNSRGVIWRKWEPPVPSPFSPATAWRLSDTTDLFVLRSGSSYHVTAGGGIPYRYWHIPADSVGQAGAVGILVSAGIVGLAQAVRNRGLEGRCQACGYDLRATPDRCPECGWSP